MDVAYYLSELLGQLGEVNVPGLGYFVLLRTDGHYNEEEATFYPPAHIVQFDPQFIDDDVLAQYIADKKNISLASSKYFTKKYIDNLNKDIMSKDVTLADLGVLSFDHSRILFKAAEIYANDPAFFGYPKIQVTKLGGTSIIEQLQSITPERVRLAPRRNAPQPAKLAEEPPAPPVNEHVIVAPEPSNDRETAVAAQEVFHPALQEENSENDEDFVFVGKTYESEGKRKRIWLILLIIFLVLLAGGALGIYGLYKYKPLTFNRLFGQMKFAPLPLKPLTKHDTAKTLTADTAKKIITDTTAHAKDTVSSLSNQPGAIDSTKIHFEIIGDSFKTLKAANKQLQVYKLEGIEAHILTGPGTGPRIKISLGTYYKLAQADSAIKKLKMSGKIKTDIYPKQINPKQ